MALARAGEGEGAADFVAAGVIGWGGVGDDGGGSSSPGARGLRRMESRYLAALDPIRMALASKRSPVPGRQRPPMSVETESRGSLGNDVHDVTAPKWAMAFRGMCARDMARRTLSSSLYSGFEWMAKMALGSEGCANVPKGFEGRGRR